MAVIWAGASVLIQYIYSDLAFESPFVLTFVCTALFSIYLPVVLLAARFGWAENPSFRDTPAAASVASTTAAAGAAGGAGGIALATNGGGGGGGGGGICYTPIAGAQQEDPGLPLRSAAAVAGGELEEEEEWGDGQGVQSVRRKPPAPLWSHVRTMRVSAVVFPLFFVANFAYNLSLAHTSVTSNTIISTTASLWTFLFRCGWRGCA